MNTGQGPRARSSRRFKTLQVLLDNGLITRDEFDERRSANLGAVLPYVATPPAANLDLPAPSPSEVVDRMKSLVTAYQAKSISAVQLQTERGIILEALLPGPAAKRARRAATDHRCRAGCRSRRSSDALPRGRHHLRRRREQSQGQGDGCAAGS